MPNHTTNILKIHTEKPLEVINKFTSFDMEERRFLDLAKCVTPPNTDAYNDVYVESQSEISDDPTFWHTWNSKNWGTKWNTYENEYEWIDTLSGSKEPFVEFRFQTAWSPPEKAIEAMVKTILEDIDTDVIVAHYYLDEGYMYEGTTVYTEQGIDTQCWEPTDKDEEGYLIGWSEEQIRTFLNLG